MKVKAAPLDDAARLKLGCAIAVRLSYGEKFTFNDLKLFSWISAGYRAVRRSCLHKVLDDLRHGLLVCQDKSRLYSLYPAWREAKKEDLIEAVKNIMSEP